MSQPLKPSGEEFPGEIKSMFVTEGNPESALVLESAHGMRELRLWFPDVSHALQWCRMNRSNFTYSPALPEN